MEQKLSSAATQSSHYKREAEASEQRLRDVLQRQRGLVRRVAELEEQVQKQKVSADQNVERRADELQKQLSASRSREREQEVHVESLEGKLQQLELGIDEEKLVCLPY